MSIEKFSLVILTKNEEENIQRSLNSISSAEEKIVFDSGSTDQTLQKAEAAGASVFQKTWLGFGKQRNAAAEKVKTDWILFLDADEEISPALNQEIIEFFQTKKSHDFDAIILKRNGVFMGKKMHYRPFAGEKLVRLYRKSTLHWEESPVHETIQTTGKRVGIFRATFLHHQHPTLVHRHYKILKYSELSTMKEKSFSMLSIALTPLAYFFIFFKNYILRLAILDGIRGVIIAHVAANYACYKRIRFYEKKVDKDSIEKGIAQHQLKNNW